MVMLILPHALYKRLGRDTEPRQAAYRELFKVRVDADMLTDLRDATNKGWGLGGHRFKDQIEALAERRAAPRPKG